MLSVGNIGLIFSFGSMMAGVTRERARRIQNKHLRPVHQSVRVLLSTVQGGSKRGTVKKYIYIKSATLYVELELSQPLSRQRVCPPPQTKGWEGHTRLRVRGWGSPNSDYLRKRLALCLICRYRRSKNTTLLVIVYQTPSREPLLTRPLL